MLLPILVALLLGSLAATSLGLILNIYPRPAAALETARQTSLTARRAKSLPQLPVRGRGRMIARALIGKYPENFDAASITVGGQTVQVDHRLAGLIKRLNAAGVPTTACCQGWHSEREAAASKRTGLHASQGAFLKVADDFTFPDEIAEAVVRSRSTLQIGNQTIEVAAAYQNPEELFSANQVFMRLLDDWARGDLDRTGARYQSAATGAAASSSTDRERRERGPERDLQRGVAA